MDFNKLPQSKTFKRAALLVGLLLIVFVSFSFGAFVGYHKARFSYAWGENYDRNFAGPHHGIFGMQGMMPFDSSAFMNAHGAFGTIAGIDSTSAMIMIKGQDNLEKTVVISSSTALLEHRSAIAFSDLETGESVVVIGTPNEQGQIEARLVRILQ